MLDVAAMHAELQRTLELVQTGRIRERPNYRSIPAELLNFGHVALSGDGEPTLSPNFPEIVQTVLHLRAQGRFPFFKLVLITNASGLDRPEVVRTLNLFTSRDEIWVKLDAGSQKHLRQVNRTECRLDDLLTNIVNVGRTRPVIIQSLFPSINGAGPTPNQIEDYVQRLNQLKEAGTEVSLVQIYSSNRPSGDAACSHLSLTGLSRIARRVREVTGLRTEVF